MRNYKLTILAFFLFATTNIAAFSQIGMASYYSDEFDGARTASGELYDKDMLTAGHKELPFGTYVRVTRLDNKKSVVVRINDRGPFYESMVIDLSSAAARKLSIQEEGKVEVKVEVVEKPSASASPKTAPAPKPKETSPPVVEKPRPKPKKEVTKSTPKKETKPTPSAPSPTVKRTPPKPKSKPKAAAKSTPKTNTNNGMPASNPDDYDIVTAKNYKQYDLYKIDLKRPKKKGYGVQVASLSSYESALRHVADLQGKWFDNILLSIEPRDNGKAIYKVILGPFDDWDSANYYKKSAKKRYKINGFVVDLSTFRY